ncbi:uncharacterized protein LOC115218615 [Argonauta hians]
MKLFIIILSVLGTGLTAPQQVSTISQSKLWKSILAGINMDKVIDGNIIVTNFQSCHVASDTWECCQLIHIKSLDIKDTVCIKLSYLRKDVGFDLRILWDNNTIYDKSISMRNPPPLCVGLPHLLDVQFCAKFYNISFENHKLSACLKLRFIAGIEEDVKIGCFSIPLLAETEVNENSSQEVLLHPIVSHRLHDVFRMNKGEHPHSGST